MAILNSLRSKMAAGTIAGSLAIASFLITGNNGNDGLEGVRYKPYQDVVGVWTVCYGHTGKDIIRNKTYSDAECRALLDKDLSNVAWQVNQVITFDIPVEMRGAIYSFVYNVGIGNFKSSTMLRNINSGDIAGACNELKRWNKAGGVVWKGLTTRREIEREVCSWGAQ